MKFTRLMALVAAFVAAIMLSIGQAEASRVGGGKIPASSSPTPCSVTVVRPPASRLRLALSAPVSPPLRLPLSPRATAGSVRSPVWLPVSALPRSRVTSVLARNSPAS